MTAIVTISCVKFCPDKGFLSAIYHLVIKYLPRSSAGICPQVHRASLERKLHERRPFYTKRNGGPDGKHSRLVSSWQVAFKSKLFPALPRCPSNKINTSLQSKEAPSSWKLMHRFHLWFFLVCSITDYGECLCVGKLSPVTLTHHSISPLIYNFYQAKF